MSRKNENKKEWAQVRKWTMKRKFKRIYMKIKLWVKNRILDKLLYEKHIEVSFRILLDMTNRELLYIYKNAKRLIPELKENNQYALIIGFNPLYKHIEYDVYDIIR